MHGLVWVLGNDARVEAYIVGIVQDIVPGEDENTTHTQIDTRLHSLLN